MNLLKTYDKVIGTAAILFVAGCATEVSSEKTPPAADSAPVMAEASAEELFRYGYALYREADESRLNPWLEEAGRKGSAQAQGILGVYYYEQKEWKKAYENLKAAHDSDRGRTAPVLYYLGECYSWGHGVARDGKKAFELYNSAWRGKYEKAAIGIARCYINGDAGYHDGPSSLMWTKRVADKDDPEAWYLMGRINSWIYDGNKDESYLEESERWLEKAAAVGQPDSYFMLFDISSERRSRRMNKPNSDEHIAMKDLMKAALVGTPGGISVLGVELQHQYHKENKNNLSDPWNNDAVSLIYLENTPEIQLGRMYYLGLICSSKGKWEDIFEGFCLCLAADKGGVKAARREVIRLREKHVFTAEQLEVAERRADGMLKDPFYRSRFFEERCDPLVLERLAENYGVSKTEVLEKAKRFRLLRRGLGLEVILPTPTDGSMRFYLNPSVQQ